MKSEPTIEADLEARLNRMRLRLELPDSDTLTVKGVPANPRCFNKSKTNLLVKRIAEGLRCVVCVDEDLNYMGADEHMVQAFVSAPAQDGWRILTFGGTLSGDLSAALEQALGMLGADDEAGNTLMTRSPVSRRLLSAWTEDLSEMAANGRWDATLYRDEEIEHAAACTLSWEGRLPLVLGLSGAGKTNLLHGVARVLALRQKEVRAVNIGALMSGTLFESEREMLLKSLLSEARESRVVLALEQAEWAILGVPRGLVLLREALDHGVRLIATSTPDHDRRFSPYPLGSRLEVVRLNELCASDTRRILELLRPAIAAHHRIEIDAEVEHATVERSLAMEGTLPGKAIRLLDLAAARASLTGSPTVTLLDVFVAASRMAWEGA